MSYSLISFDELTKDYIGRQIHIRTEKQDLAVIEVLDVNKEPDIVHITFKHISGESDKFKTAGASAVAARERKCWKNPAKFWLPYNKVTSSKSYVPENNDGRDTCRFCGGKTRKCGGLNMFTDYRVCKVCGR